MDGLATASTSSARFSAPVLAAVRGWTPCSRRKASASVPLTAKLTFCGMSPPVICATRAAFSLETTTPMTLPRLSNSGPPELPGCTAALIWKLPGLSRMPASALMLPVVSDGPDESRPESGKP